MAKKYMTAKTAKFFQEKQKSAATAPTWKRSHDDGGDPVDAALLVLAAHAEVLLDLACDLGGAAEGGDAALGGEGAGRGDGLCWRGYSARKRLRAWPGGGRIGDEKGWRHWVGLTSEVAVTVCLTRTLAARGSAEV
jgi:hypothetical protein